MIPNQNASPTTGVSWRGVGYTRYTVTHPTTGDNASVFVPDTIAEGDNIRLMSFQHGRGGSETSIYNTNEMKIVFDLLERGFVIVAPNAHGSKWGNRQAQDDINGMYDWAAGIWTIKQYFLYGVSMGGNAVANAIRLNERTITGAIMLFPSINLQDVWDRGNAGHDNMEEAFGLSPTATAAEVSAAIADWNPVGRPASEFTHVPFIITGSEEDTYVGAYKNLEPFVRKINRAGGDAKYIQVAGGHAAWDHYRLDEFLAFIESITPHKLAVPHVYKDSAWVRVPYEHEFRIAYARPAAVTPYNYTPPTVAQLNATIVSKSQVNYPYGSSATRTINKPADVQDGDVLIFIQSGDWGDPTTFDVPTGFTRLQRFGSATSNAGHIALGYKVASSEPASYTMTRPTSSDVNATILCIRNADTASTPPSAGVNTASSATSFPAPSVTPSSSRGLLISAVGQTVSSAISSSAWAWNPPTNMTEEVEVEEAYSSLTAASQRWDDSSATGTRTFTLSNTIPSRSAQAVSVWLPSVSDSQPTFTADSTDSGTMSTTLSPDSNDAGTFVTPISSDTNDPGTFA